MWVGQPFRCDFPKLYVEGAAIGGSQREVEDSLTLGPPRPRASAREPIEAT